MKPIVVGLDDSAGARAALRWALDYAKRLSSPVVAVSAIELPQIVGRAANLTELTRAEDVKAGTTQWMQAMVDEERGSDSSVAVTVHVVEGHPVDVLVKESSDAQLLVVGARGAGVFHRLLLGSVSTGVLHHADCSVVIVRSQ
jgi:nucleotide-binding universal stress UspA family protein